MDESKKQEVSVWKDISKQAAKDVKADIIAQAENTAVSMISNIVYSCADLAVRIAESIITKGKMNTVPTSRGRRYSNDPNKYSNISRQTTAQPQQSIGLRRSDKLEYKKIQTYQEARDIKLDLVETIEKFGKVRLSDFYEKVRITPSNTDFNYGWNRVEDIHFKADGDGFVFDMPDPIRL